MLKRHINTFRKVPSQMEYKLALSPAEAAKALGVSRSTVYRMISSGQLLVVKVGRRTLVAKSALVALLQTGGDVS